MEHNMFNYFVPRGTTPLGIEAIDAAAAVHGGMACIRRCKVKRLLFVLETAVVGTSTAPVVEFNRRPTIASSSGEVALGTLTIPNGTALGKVVFKDIDPVTFKPGEELSFELLTQAVGGTVAGDGYYAVECDDFPEEDPNLSNMLESA
jgi:hypothetical protein